MIMNPQDTLSATFAALAHPARRAILARLADGETTVNVLAEPLDMSLPAVSRHIKVLESAGLIQREKDAQFRRCIMKTEPLQAVASWTEQYRPIWEARFDEMERCLIAMTETPDES
jgi:DNA-binding transcriptional ArsR family regulator